MRTGLRWILAAFMLFAGVAHFTAHATFLKQVPPLLPARPTIVAASGVVEIGFGVALAGAPARYRPWVGWALVAFLVLVFPGNIYQAVAGTDAFGLRSPGLRWGRLAVQPVLIAWGLWATGAWRAPAVSRADSIEP